MTNILEKFNGVKIKVLNFEIRCDSQNINVIILFELNGEINNLLFTNVSKIFLNDISLPFEVSGFEIICNKNRGWSKDCLYTVEDYEDGKIKFYCENISFI